MEPISRDWIRNHTGCMIYDFEKTWSSQSPPITLLATALLRRSDLNDSLILIDTHLQRHLNWRESTIFEVAMQTNIPRHCPSPCLSARVCVCGRGGGWGWRPGNLGVIVVLVCEPVFRNLPHSYTWPLEKRTHSYTWSSEMLTVIDRNVDLFIYCTLIFIPIYCW